MGFGNLAVLILQQIGLVAVQDAGRAAGQAGGMLLLQALARRLDTEHLDVGIVEEGVEQADGVAAAADRGDQQIGQATGAGLHLRLGLGADHALEIAHQFRIGMRTGGGADNVKGVVDIGDPVAQRLVHRVLQGARAAFHADHFGTQQFHAEHIGRLPLHVARAHIDDAGQAEARGNGGGGHAMLARAGLGDDAGLAHAHGEQDLAHAIVDLVRAGVIQLVALEPDLRAFPRRGAFAHMIGQALGIIKRAWAPDIMFQQIVELRPERRVLLGCAIFALQIEDERHERLGDIASAIGAEMPTVIGAGTIAVRLGNGLCHNPAPLRRRRGSSPHP